MITSRIRKAFGLVASLGIGLTSVPAGAAPFAYVPVSNGIGIFDTATDTVVGTIPVFVGRVVVNSTGTRVYGMNYQPGPIGTPPRNKIVVIDTASNAVVATIPFAGSIQASEIALSGDDRRLYVGELDPSPPPGIPNSSVAVFDTATNTRITTVDVGAPSFFSTVMSIAVDPSRLRSFVGVNNYGSDSITVLGRICDEVRTTFDRGGNNLLRKVLIHPDGTRLYALDYLKLAVLDPTSGATIAQIPFNNATEMAISPSGDRIYVSAVYSDNRVYAVDTTSNTIATSVLMPSPPGGVVVHPNGTKIYVAQANSVISVLAANDLRTLGALTVGTFPTLGPGAIASGVTVPSPPEAVPPANVSITGIEVTQGIQDLANSVHLVRGRKTFARVYVKSDGPTVPNVTATLNGVLVGVSGGTTVKGLLPPIAPVSAGPLTVGPTMSRLNLAQSFLFELPWSWTANNALYYEASLGTNTPPPALCQREIEAANLVELPFPTSLKPVFVRLRYLLPGVANPAAETTVAEVDQSASYIERTYPVSNLDKRDYFLFDAELGKRVARTSGDCQEPFLDADDANLCAHRYITAKLAALQAETNFMGNADLAYALIPQHPAGPFTRGACCTERVGAGPADDSTYAAHEIGHFLGRNHPAQGAAECGNDAADPAYPHWLGYIGPHAGSPVSADSATALAGFDKGDTRLGRPQRHIYAGSFWDFMTYCSPLWISDYTWNGLYVGMRALRPDLGEAGFGGMGGAVISSGPSGPEPVAGDWLQAFGSVTGDGTQAAFTEVKRLASVVRRPERTPGALTLRLVGAGGAVLADYPFTPQRLDGGPAPTDTSNPDIATFSHVVPFVAGTRDVQIVNTALAGAPVIGNAPVSAHAPIVTRVALRAPPDPQTGIAVLEWDAADDDGDPLAFDVRLVADGSSMPQPLLLGLDAREANVDTSPLAGGSVRLEVVASDGVLRGSATSAPFAIAPKPPAPVILAPADGDVVTAGSTLNLEGEAGDPKDGKVAESALAWSADGAPIGAGARLSLPGLATGAHTLTLAATNTAGLTASRSIQITVGETAATAQPRLAAGPVEIAWHVVPGETALQRADVTVDNAGDGAPLGFSAALSAPWVVASATSGTTPATLTLTANPASFAAGAVEKTTLTLTASDPEAGSVVIPVSLAAGDTFSNGADAEPDVTPPSDATVPATEAGGARPAASLALTAFLQGGSAVDGTDPAPHRLAPLLAGNAAATDTLFPVGISIVTFRFQDASGNVGTAQARVNVSPGSGAAACDVDQNAQVDRNDVDAIFGARGTNAPAGDPRDADGDGTISVLDAALCRAQCTYANCRTTPPNGTACGLGAEIAVALAAIDILRRRVQRG